MAVVVSDTSPIRALAHLGHLDWLEKLFTEIVLPPTVVHELDNPPAGMRPVDVSSCPFLQIRTPGSAERVMELRLLLDRGESEAIALAEEINAEAILMDELAGRGVAMRSGLTVLGTLGIALRAKQQGLCTGVRPLLDRLQREINFFVSPALRQYVLGQAGEPDV